MPGPGWSPTEEERAELGPRALDRLGVTLAEFSFSAVEGLGYFDAEIIPILRSLQTEH